MKKILTLFLCYGALVMQAQTVSVKDDPSGKPQKHTDQYFYGFYGINYGSSDITSDATVMKRV